MTAGPHLKHQAIASLLEGEIRSGALPVGEQLPGEVALAERFSVSRNTVRAALSDLGRAGLISTRSGKGSYVIFEGGLGWARARSGNAADHALAALAGLALGDALGMPTQLMSRSEIASRFGSVTAFHAATPDHPIAGGMKAGSITDDTEQALLVARLLVEGQGHVDLALFARELVRWEDRMRNRGSLDLLGPSTKRAVDAVVAGEPLETAGRYGTTNGAAMRVTPVGIACSTEGLASLVDRVVEVSMVTHNTGIALAGAAAVAAAVSAGIDGVDPLPVALEAAAIAGNRGYWVAGGDVAARIAWACTLADPTRVERSLDDIYRLVGTSLATQESVPAAFALLTLFPDDPWKAVCAAASLGGDTDTIAAIVGAIGGAVHGTWPSALVTTVVTVNHLELEPIAASLMALRLGS